MELFGMEAGSNHKGGHQDNLGKSATIIWIMQLPLEKRARFVNGMAEQFFEMSQGELEAVKRYTAAGSWTNYSKLGEAA